MFVILNIRKCVTKFVVFMISLHTNFTMPSYNGSLSPTHQMLRTELMHFAVLHSVRKLP